ncbi:MAG: uridine diphosphate-N-acetylglucosamine-binding protein YvcK [Acidimicrobiia bacterium]
MTRVVAIGGGHGLAVTLRAARSYAEELTAVVSIADDGGSTGRLRDSWDVPAPGDVRRCLSALADPAGTWSRVVERRFDVGELAGHAVGNLLLLALTEELGEFQGAVDELSGLLDIDVGRVRVVPVADDPVVLVASVDGRRIEGQVAVAAATAIEEVWVEPRSTSCSPLAVGAVRGADQIVLGPGSLFTSVLAAAVVGDLREALSRSSARTVYVCNLDAEPTETKGFDVADHVTALVHHGIVPDVVVCQPGALPLGDVPCEVVLADLREAPGDGAHDPGRLASTLAALR